MECILIETLTLWELVEFFIRCFAALGIVAVIIGVPIALGVILYKVIK